MVLVLRIPDAAGLADPRMNSVFAGLFALSALQAQPVNPLGIHVPAFPLEHGHRTAMLSPELVSKAIQA